MRRQMDGTYVAVDRPVLLMVGALVFAFSFGLAAWQRYGAHAFDLETAMLALAALAGIAGAFALPATKFVFDPERKLITWESRSAFKSSGGQLEFSSVRDVIVQTMRSDEGGTSYRVALQTAGGVLPLGVEYSGGQLRAQALVREIRALLGMSLEAAT